METEKLPAEPLFLGHSQAFFDKRWSRSPHHVVAGGTLYRGRTDRSLCGSSVRVVGTWVDEIYDTLLACKRCLAIKKAKEL
jgi:hypothetical protein